MNTSNSLYLALARPLSILVLDRILAFRLIEARAPVNAKHSLRIPAIKASLNDFISFSIVVPLMGAS